MAFLKVRVTCVVFGYFNISPIRFRLHIFGNFDYSGLSMLLKFRFAFSMINELLGIIR